MLAGALDRNHIKQSRRDIEFFLLASLTTQLDDLCDRPTKNLKTKPSPINFKAEER
ncbi:MAG: hypothetical protein V7L22_15290 [Nostoc sp.]|uniref:hypothetical protein n=1 Tax=Nostoc sp. TaxID=1180 RepID=UPI002FF688B9